MRQQMLETLKQHAKANSQLHCMNIEVYLKNPAGIGEHSDITEAIQCEIDKIARYHDQVEVIERYFAAKR